MFYTLANEISYFLASARLTGQTDVWACERLVTPIVTLSSQSFQLLNACEGYNVELFSN